MISICIIQKYESRQKASSIMSSVENNHERNVLLDNIKGICIFLVVLGHLLAGRNTDVDIIGLTHYVIYSVHMPIFIFLSGYFSTSKYNLRNFFRSCFIPYLLFDVAYNLFLFAFGGDYNFNVLFPSFVLWYILCIGIQRGINSFVAGRRAWIFGVMIVSVMVSFMSPSVNITMWKFLSLGRMFLLFPVFMLGNWTLEKDWINRIYAFRMRGASQNPSYFASDRSCYD